MRAKYDQLEFKIKQAYAARDAAEAKAVEAKMLLEQGQVQRHSERKELQQLRDSMNQSTTDLKFYKEQNEELQLILKANKEEVESQLNDAKSSALWEQEQGLRMMNELDSLWDENAWVQHQLWVCK